MQIRSPPPLPTFLITYDSLTYRYIPLDFIYRINVMTRNDVCVEIERRARFCATQLTLCYGGRMTLDSYGSQRVTESIEKAVLLLCLPSACTLLNAGVIVVDIF